MPLYVYRDKCKNYKQEGFNHEECDQIGFLMVGLGIREIKKNNIEEMVFRYCFLQKVAYYRSDTEHNATDARKLFKQYIGLQINGDDQTRNKFMSNCSRALERDVEYNIRKAA